MGLIDNVHESIQVAKGDWQVLNVPKRLDEVEKQLDELSTNLAELGVDLVNFGGDFRERIGILENQTQDIRNAISELATQTQLKDLYADVLVRIPTVDEIRQSVEDVVPDIVFSNPDGTFDLSQWIKMLALNNRIKGDTLIKILRNVGSSTRWATGETLNDYLNKTFALVNHEHGNLVESISGLVKISDLKSMVGGFSWGLDGLSIDGISNALKDKIGAMDIPTLNFRFGILELDNKKGARNKLDGFLNTGTFTKFGTEFWKHLIDYENMFKFDNNPLKDFMGKLQTARRNLVSAQYAITGSIDNLVQGFGITERQLGDQLGYLNDRKGDLPSFAKQMVFAFEILINEIRRTVVNVKNIGQSLDDAVGEISDGLGDIELASNGFYNNAISKLQW